MNIYIASRQKHKDYAKEILNQLSKYGCELSFDWTKIPNLTPYNKNNEKSSYIAEKITEAIKKSKLFILISDEGGTDMFIELGIALANRNNKIAYPKIYSLGEHNNRSLMLNHPLINQVKSIEEIIKKEFSHPK